MTYAGFAAAESSPRIIELDARQFIFEPSIITIDVGEEIIFRVKSVDVTHGFYIDGKDVMEELKPGDVVDIGPISFDTPGKYKIRCAVTCGPLHPFMTADIIVEPNYSFYVFIVLTFVFAGITIAYLGKTGKTPEIPEQYPYVPWEYEPDEVAEKADEKRAGNSDDEKPDASGED